MRTRRISGGFAVRFIRWFCERRKGDMEETSNTPEYDKFKARCIAAVEGMKFFDQPVQDMTAEELLVVVGHLVTENVRLQKADHAFQSKLANDITDAFLERLWIPVSERVPDRGQIVLASCSDVPPQSFMVAVCTYDKHLPENEYGFRTDWAEDIRPTHWMPLPAPPETSK